MDYDNIVSHKKQVFILSEKYIFTKTKGGGGRGVQIDTSENPYVENAYRNGSILI